MEDQPKKNPIEKSPIAKREAEILAFWREHTIFKKSLEKPSPKGEFVFYDGPPFATGHPHYGHLLAGTMKDVIPRFKTMQGFHVPRRWGWDTHGLPIENLVEKELGLKSKKDIEDLGIEKFNDVARKTVFMYDHVWKEIVPRTGRWIDMDNAYITMNPSYSESIWWSFKNLYDKNLIYNGFKSMMLCPHCGTTLSNFEVVQGYKDITDISVYAKFEIAEKPKTYVLAWTTTPWTLPGNVALAIGRDINYAVIEFEDGQYILGEERVEKVFKDKQYKILSVVKGNTLVGTTYKPVFNYYQNADIKNIENGWKIVAADFVTTTDGTGIVHIAPAFGEDDYNLSVKENLPFIQHVAMDGTFKKEVTDFAGTQVKPKDDHQKADVEVIKYLAKQGTLFAKEKLIHSYPHCWRCDTPLLNYATSSWFVKVTDFKDKLVTENNNVKWVPEEIGEGRFGKWLENARDWAISRSRYWGAPLPVWKCKECNKMHVMGSVADVQAKTKRNKYIVVRHGESQSNVQGVLSCVLDSSNCLTDHGKEVVAKSASELTDKKIDLIISSDLQRTKDTAELIAHTIGISKEHIVYDERLREYNFGEFNGKNRQLWHDYWKDRDLKDAELKVPGGESPSDVRNRVAEFLYETDKKYEGKTILIVSHQDPIAYLQWVATGKSIVYLDKKDWQQNALDNAEVRKLDFAFIPHNRSYELDLHRPFIDEVLFNCDCGGEMKRVPEVFDTWYESGSMPFASIHYPFENKELIDSGSFFPADLIAEGQDQTRGWFYSLLVLSTSLFGTSPYKNVIVNGIVLAEDGQKMSKRLKNYPEVTDVLDKYGADAMRFYLMNAPVVRAQDLAFSEKGVDEVVKKLMQRLQNVYSFYAMYESEFSGKGSMEANVLDRWIVARLHELGREVTKNLESYQLDKAAKPFMLFVDDLSTWYLRRSRDRFKGDDKADRDNALVTLKYVMKVTAKLIAPYMPFMAEDIYLKLQPEKESVHLESWPEYKEVTGDETTVLTDMAEVRRLVSLGLEARAKANIKVRQPLASFSIGKALPEMYASVITDELNVKALNVNEALQDGIELDTVITPELKREGQAREFIRALQEQRKKNNFNPTDAVEMVVETDEAGKALIESYHKEISKTAQLKSITYGSVEGEKVTVDDISFSFILTK